MNSVKCATKVTNFRFKVKEIICQFNVFMIGLFKECCATLRNEKYLIGKPMAMKSKVLILGILLISLLSSCSKDTDTSHANIVNGQWKLINVSGSFSGVNSNFVPGIITWDFNPTTQTVTVINNNTDSNLTDIFETGVYNYQVVENENPQLCTETIRMDGIEMGCFNIINGDLKIDQAFTDGYSVTLKR